MKLRDSIVIAAPAEQVWPLVADPAVQAGWNPKIVAVDRRRSGPATLGEQFQISYRMSRQQVEYRTSVIECEPWRCIAFRHLQYWKQAESIIVERYELLERSAGVRLKQSVDLAQSGMPWPFQFLFWFVHQFGRATEKPYLVRLRELAQAPLA